MLKIIQAETAAHVAYVRELFGEYLQWVGGMLQREFGFNTDIAAILEQDMRTLSKFAPPTGRLLLASDAGQVIGLGCLRSLSAETGEIKRMYVRPPFRGRGIGRALLTELLAQAHAIGYQYIRLDSAPFLPESHALYRSAGFREIPAYPGVEIPQEFHHNWLFMEKLLA